MIRALLNLYILLLVIDTVLSYMPSLNKNIWALRIKKYANFSLAPIRKYLPPSMPFDISPLIAILLIKIFESLW